MAKFKEKIVLVYSNKYEKFQEKSDKIECIKTDVDYTRIKYRESPNWYKHRTEHVIRLELEGTIDPSGSDVYISGKLHNGIEAMGFYTTHYAILYKSLPHISYIDAGQVKIERNAGKQILPYLAAVAACKKGNPDGETEESTEQRESFLASQVKKISPSGDTVLSHYLNGKPIKTNESPATYIYPFSVNTSQKIAIRQAMEHNISIIQGPPGTGKTQSILNLIANILYNGKSVGIVSNNNSAVENVKEKLVQNGYGFVMAHLGKKENRERFFESVDPEFAPDPDWQQSTRTIRKYTRTLEEIGKKIDRLLSSKEELAKCKEHLSLIERESKDFFGKFGYTDLPTDFDKLRKWDSRKLLSFKTALNYFPENLSLRVTPFFLYFVLKFGKIFLQASQSPGLEFSLALDSLIYEKTTHEISIRIGTLQQLIDKSDLKKLNADYAEISGILFRHSLYQRYAHQRNPEFTLENYKGGHFTAFLDRFPVILSTTHAILNSVSKPLDYIIIDESSQVDIITASLAFSACRNVVIVGDSQQLSHIVGEEKEQAEALAGQYKIPAAYDYVKSNLITSLEKLYGTYIPKTLLKEHYRCNPLIIGFCNQKYYKGELVIMTEGNHTTCGDKNYPMRIIRTVEGHHARNNVNERQIAVIDQEIIREFPDTDLREIGIISPYRNQASEIVRRLCQGSGMEADTIHKYQGREKKKIIFTTVSNAITPFMDSTELINVAVSRAIDQFIMVMPHSYELTHGSNIGDLIRYIEHWNPDGTVDSHLISYFDLLNPGGHSPLLNEFKRKVKSKSRFDSENIIEALIGEILDENPVYSGIDIKRGYPLYLMVPRQEGLSDREKRYCNDLRSHVDFLLINRCDNSFVMAIEVDGYTYHSTAEQQERDAIKNKVLAMNGIELLRLSTRGILEKEKISEKLASMIYSEAAGSE